MPCEPEGVIGWDYTNNRTVFFTETSSKMASTLCHKLLTTFCQKAQSFVWFGPYDFFFQISPVGQ